MSKVTVKENKVDEIDFSIAGQWLISDNGFIVMTTGNHKDGLFECILLHGCGICTIKESKTDNEWSKKYFTKFNGTITIEQ